MPSQVPEVPATSATPKAAFDLEAAAKAARIDVDGAKAALVKLDGRFEGAHGDIPNGALERWVDAFFDNTRARIFFMALGREWEREIAGTLAADRKWERDPKAAKPLVPAIPPRVKPADKPADRPADRPVVKPAI